MVENDTCVDGGKRTMSLRLWVMIPIVWSVGGYFAPRGADGQTGSGLKLFAGKVQQVNARERWFVVKCVGSKKYPTVKVILDKTTQWSGLPRKSNMVLVGDPIRVEAAAAKDGTFHAATVRVLDPNQKPSMGRPNPAP